MDRLTETHIIGAGIGGLTCAIALIQKGFSPILYDKTKTLKPVGSGIVLGLNAMAVMKDLGIADSIMEAGYIVPSFSLENQAGLQLNQVDFTHSYQTYGLSSVALSRHRLHEILFSSIPEKNLRLSAEFNSFESFIEGHQIQSPEKSLSLDPQQSRKQLNTLFSHWDSPIPELIDSAEDAHVLPLDIYDRKPGPQWYKNNTVLLGDSIHPTTPNLGQGAGMAIESAVILAEALAKANTAPEAFKQYYQLRKKRTKFITDASFLFGVVSQLENKGVCWVRDRVLWGSALLTPSWVMRKMQERMLAVKGLNRF